MGNILAFLSRYHKFFIFVLLELISLSLIVQFNAAQNRVFFSWALEATGKVRKVYSGVNYYFHLAQANDSLMNENARLRAGLRASQLIDTGRAQKIIDTVKKQRYTYIPARVVNNSVSHRNNYITIAGGTNKGIGKHEGVISTSGIVGITNYVSPHFTSVLSLLHKDFTVSAEIVEIGEIGSLVWDGKNPSFAIMKEVPLHIHIKAGQHISTSPYSNIFPEGTPIGTIQSFEVNSGEEFYTIHVRLSADMRNLRHVYVVKDIEHDEREQVQQKQEASEKTK
jgi:rod shape-determining protein MreC